MSETFVTVPGGRLFVSDEGAATDPPILLLHAGIADSRTWDAMTPYATGGVYLNFAGLDHEADRQAVFGSAAGRLDRVRQLYDPTGLFADAGGRP